MWCNHNEPFYMAKFLEQGDVLVCPTEVSGKARTNEINRS